MGVATFRAVTLASMCSEAEPWVVLWTAAVGLAQQDFYAGSAQLAGVVWLLSGQQSADFLARRSLARHWQAASTHIDTTPP